MGKKFTSQRGQSLVETALILPVILLLLAGVVEVSNLLITTNRIETAATAAARFAADGGRMVHIVALNSVTQTLDISEGVWDIWVIEAEVNAGGDDFATWDVQHVYGISATSAFTEVVTRLEASCTITTAVGGPCIQDRVLTDLQSDQSGTVVVPNPGNPSTQIAAGLEVVGVYIVHEVDSILGLQSFDLLGDVLTVDALGAMRSGSLATTDPLLGCSTAFPFVVDGDTRPLFERAQYDALLPDIVYPATPPTFNSFQRNYFGSSPPAITGAQEGYLFLFSEASFRLTFAKWNSAVADGPATLATDLSWPGTLADPTNGFFEVGNALDTQLQLTDRIGHNSVTNPFTNAAVQAVLREHIDRGRGLRIIVEEPGGARPQRTINLPPEVYYYEVNGFANIRLHAYGVDSSNRGFLIAEFINWDTSCGQTDQE